MTQKHRAILILLGLLALPGCYQAQIKGPVASASISVSEINTGKSISQASSWDSPLLLELLGQETLDSFSDFNQLILLGVFSSDDKQFKNNRFYLLTASGGEDFDTDQNLQIDTLGTPVLSDWHAITVGRDLKKAGLQVSVLTEVVYQYLSPRLSNLTKKDLKLQLNLLAERLLTDITQDNKVNYRDVLEWSQMFDRQALLVDTALVADFEDALLSGAEAFTLRQLANSIVDSGTPRTGEMVYRFTQPTGNSFTCASCHALEEPASNGIDRPGHPLGSSTHRPTYKDGQLTEMLDAVNSCRDEWMNADLWTESSPDWLALAQWLEQRAAPGDADVVDIQIAEIPTDLTGGDGTRGRSKFNTSCSGCHAKNGSGSIQAPPIAGFGLDPELIANRVRLSGRTNSGVYQGLTGGIMPFWGGNRLSDSDLLDIIAYVSQGEDANTGGGDEGTDGSTDPDSCGADHPKVGQSTTLITRQHRVSGTATIVDNCTIEIENFNYDGRGIVVQAYSGVDGDFRGANGVALSPDLVGPNYNNTTLTVNLPDKVSLDNFNSLSIWCVEVGISFGDGIFQ